MIAPPSAAERRTDRKPPTYERADLGPTAPLWLHRPGSITVAAEVDGVKIRQRLVPGMNTVPVALLDALAADPDFLTHCDLGHVVLDAPEVTITWAHRALAAIEALYQDRSAPARASSAFCRDLVREYLARGVDRGFKARAEHMLKTLARVEAEARR